jgi:hypothetical protein
MEDLAVEGQVSRHLKLTLRYSTMESEFGTLLLLKLLRIKSIREFLENPTCGLLRRPFCDFRGRLKCDSGLNFHQFAILPRKATRDTKMARAAGSHEYPSHQMILKRKLV